MIGSSEKGNVASDSEKGNSPKGFQFEISQTASIPTAAKVCETLTAETRTRSWTVTTAR